MAMLPIFVLGLAIGYAVGYAVSLYRKEWSSDVKVHILEETVIGLKEDIDTLEKSNKELREKLSKAKLK